MHDRTRRQLCRIAFLMLCVLPSAVVLIWTAWRGGKGHQRACAAELSHTVGLNIACAAVSFPRPGITLYQGVELSDPETASPLARMRFLETGGSGTTSVWVASQPELDAAQLRDFWLLVDQRLREASDTAATTRISAAEATLHWPAGAQTLTDIVGQISMPADGEPRTAMLSFRIAGIDMPEPVRLRVTRQRDSTPTSMAGARGSQLKTKLEFDTCGGALPCAMLAVPLGIANHLGTQAKFRGSVWATETADGWDGELSGQFTDVDLQILVSEQFPHRLSGAAEITVQKARFRHGRLEEAAGTLSAGPGVVSQSLVAAAIEFLHLAPRPANHHAEDMLRQYEQLSLAFVVDASGLTLHGQCSGAAGAVMRLGDGTVLSEPAGSSGPIAALVRTLVPQSAVQVPATRESGWLIGRLPVPQVVLREDQPPQGRLRLERNP